MQFLKPKKYDPDAAKRLAEEEAEREAKARSQRVAEKARRRAMKEELGLSDSKLKSRTRSNTGNGTDHHNIPQQNSDNSDYSAPSASDTSDSSDEDAFDNNYDEGDDGIASLLNKIQLKGEPMCPMRQYELLQRRYIRIVQEVKNLGEKEREHENLVSELKLFAKKQRSIIIHNMKETLKGRDKLIRSYIDKIKSFDASNSANNAGLIEIAGHLEDEFQEISESTFKLLNPEKSDRSNNEVLSLHTGDQDDIDTIKVHLSKVNACNDSLKDENNRLREALVDLGNQDPEKLVVVRQQLEDAKEKLKDTEQSLEEAILEKEAAEECAMIARGAEQAAKSRAEALVNQGSAKTLESNTGVDRERENGEITQKLRRSGAHPASNTKPSASTSSAPRLSKDIRRLKSKVKKLEASKLALMSILKDAQAELSKRAKEHSDAPKDVGRTKDIAHVSSENSDHQAKDLIKKDKTIKKLKRQVKELTSILRELEETRKDSKTSGDGQPMKASTEEVSRIAALERELLNARTESTSKIALLVEENEKISLYNSKKVQTLEQALKTAQEDATKQRSFCEELQQQLLVSKREATNTTKRLENSMQSFRGKAEKLSHCVVAFKREVLNHETGIRTQLDSLRVDVQSELEKIPSIVSSIQDEMTSKLSKQLSAFQGLADKYKREFRERKRLFNLVQELRGNIRVFCRVRPISGTEEADRRRSVISFPVDEADELIVEMANGRRRRFEFDKVLKPGCSNNDVFSGVADLCMSVLDGFNVCIFAYGQTGSGKTHTMEGPESDRGINFRALQHLFQLIEERGSEFEYTVEVSLLEIYNESIRDLLVTRQTKKLEIKRDASTGMHVPGLTMVKCTSHEEVLAIMAHGYANRAKAATDMNAHSSRSHCALSVYVTAKSMIDGRATRGKMHLIDLAGSERLSKSGAEGQRRKEAQAINKSLSALGDVIQARKEKQKHVPYRNSTLTYLLQDSLAGNSKTLMIVQASPVDYNSSETIATLNWGQRARAVELGKATKNKG